MWFTDNITTENCMWKFNCVLLLVRFSPVHSSLLMEQESNGNFSEVHGSLGSEMAIFQVRWWQANPINGKLVRVSRLRTKRVSREEAVILRCLQKSCDTQVLSRTCRTDALSPDPRIAARSQDPKNTHDTFSRLPHFLKNASNIEQTNQSSW